MSVAKVKMHLFRLVSAVFIVALFLSIIPASPVGATSPAPVNKACVGNGIQTQRTSPFDPTSGMCLGVETSDASIEYYQFSVTFEKPVNTSVSHAIVVSGKSDAGTNISFVKVSNTLWVSNYASSTASYSYKFKPGVTSSACPSGPDSKITVTAIGNGAVQSFPIELCGSIGNDKTLINNVANQIPGDDASVATTGNIKGKLGVKRNTDIDRLKEGLLQKRGVTSLKLSGTTAAGKAIEIDGDANSSNEIYTLSDGNFSMPAEAGTYKLEIVYNDAIVIVDDVNGASSMTASDFDFVFEPIIVLPGGDVWVGNSKNSPYFLTTDNSLAHIASSTATKSSCAIDGVGWIVCSMANFIATVSDGIYGLVEQLLKVPPINTNIGTGTNGVYNAWQIMRSFANVAFVIVFLIIIFSQLTSLGISNYGVKKALPRLVVAAILVNISFWVSAIAVDLSNVIGAGIYDLLSGVKNSMNIGISDGANWGNIILALLGGSAIAISGGVVVAAAGVALASLPGIGMALLFLALPLLLGAVLAILIAAFVLVARQALVIILIIVSPLAFVALLLPNTEKLFTKWRQMLMSLLLMYPIVSILFGGAQIAGLAIMSTAANAGSSVNQDNAVAVGLAIITGQLVMVAPFFFLPLIITKFSGGNLDKLASTLTNKGKGLIGGISGMSRKEGMDRLGRGFRTAKYGAAKTEYGRNGQETLRSRMRSAVRSNGRLLDQAKDKKAMADDYLKDEQQGATRTRLMTDGDYALDAAGGDAQAARALQSRAQAAAEAANLKRALEPLVREVARARANGQDVDKFLADRVRNVGGNYSEDERAAALHQLGTMGRDHQLRTLRQEFATTPDGNMGVRLEEAIQANVSALSSRAPDLVKPQAAAFDNINGSDLAGFSAETTAAYMKYLSANQGNANIVAAFNSAIEDIALNPNLAGSFKQNSGNAILAGMRGNPTLQAAAPNVAHIQPDGKIR